MFRTGSASHDPSPNTPEFDPEKINIYFAGNYIPDGTPSTADPVIYGATYDPATYTDPAEPGTAYPYPYIRIQDGGGRFGSPTPGTHAARLTLEHELEHYLARFTVDRDRNGRFVSGRVLGTSPHLRQYDAEEHANVNPNLLLGGQFVPVGGGRQLVVPGRSFMSTGSNDVGADELGEISKRIYEGRWNLP